MENQPAEMRKNWTGERLQTDIFSDVSIEHLHRYAVALELVEGKTVLDLACGEGYGSALLAGKALSVTGIDIDAATIRAAGQKYHRPNLKFTAAPADATELPSASFDLITSFETIEHVENPQAVLTEMKRLLRPCGLLIISTPDKKWYTDNRAYTNPFHKKEFYRDEFEAFLNATFSHTKLLDQRYFSGSLLAAEGDTKMPTIYSGDFNAVQAVQMQPHYLLAMASDAPLPSIPTSFFDGAAILRTALEVQEAAYRNSASYRLGHALLSPLKWIRKRFRS